MSDTGQHEADEHARLRQLLKNLPPVEASPDFEQRLHRTIQNELSPRVEAPRRFVIPAFAYSLAMLLVVTVVSYYAFFRAEDVPVMREERSSPAERREPASDAKPSVTPKTGGSAAVKGKDAAPQPSTPAATVEAPKPSTRENVAPGPVMQRFDREKSRQAEGEKAEAPPANAVDASADKLDGKAVAPQAEPPSVAPQFDVKEELKRSNVTAPEQSPVRGIMSPSVPLMKSAAAATRNSFEADIPAVADSAARLDSLARDSLRLQEQRSLQDRPRKRKRPLE